MAMPSPLTPLVRDEVRKAPTPQPFLGLAARGQGETAVRLASSWSCRSRPCQRAEAGKVLRNCLTRASEVASVKVYFFFFLVYLFILEREKEHEWQKGRVREREREREREGGRERIPSRLHAVSTGPDAGRKLMT